VSEENYKSIKYIEKESPTTKSLREVWLGIYRGIKYEINKFKFGPDDKEDRWTHYIIITLDQIPEELREKFWLKPELKQLSGSKSNYISHNYYDSIISNLEFHGGCTYYEHLSGHYGESRIVKIGCDYQHYWDEGRQYDLKYVESEVRATIDSLWTLCGRIKYRSFGDGAFRYEEEFEK